VRRKLFKFAAALSLLLYATTMALSVWSRQTTVVLTHYQWKHTRWQAILDRSQLGVNNQPQLDWEQKQTQSLNAQRFFTEALTTHALERLQAHHDFVRSAEPDVETQALKADVATARRNFNHVMTLSGAQTVTPPEHHELPLSLLAALAAVLPGLWLVWVRDRKPVPGVCVCSYNLTGNTSGVCPECGTPVAGRGP
jgi:hypothetical protein